MQRLHFRSIWISDTHLGGKNLHSEHLHDFLESTDCEYLYLTGDILDLWKLGRQWYWPAVNDRIVKLILAKARSGTKVYYLPGNHDAVLHRYAGLTIQGVTIIPEVIHTALDGRRYLTLHGDQFDTVSQQGHKLAAMGSIIYDFLLLGNRWYNRYRSRKGKPPLAISAWLKQQCKRAVNSVGGFEEALLQELAAKDVDGVVCGHLHQAAVKDLGAYLYSNSGDWVESYTALAENAHGHLGVIQWLQQDICREQVTRTAYANDRYRDRCLAPTT